MTTQLEPVRIPASACPKCEKRCDSATPLGRSFVPKPGDISVCLGCGLVLIFGPDLRLGRASKEDVAALPLHVLITISRLQDRITHRLARRN
jgi:hypothetical protein